MQIQIEKETKPSTETQHSAYFFFFIKKQLWKFMMMIDYDCDYKKDNDGKNKDGRH